MRETLKATATAPLSKARPRLFQGTSGGLVLLGESQRERGSEGEAGRH